MPLWTDAIIGDCTHLGAAEFGAYMSLLIVSWRATDCVVKSDRVHLAKISRLGKNWSRHERTILEFFTEHDDRLLNKKLLKVREVLVVNSRKKLISTEHRVWLEVVAPGYAGELASAKRHTGGGTGPAAADGRGPRPPLGEISAAGYEAAREAAPGWDIYMLETKWRAWTATTGAAVKDVDKAFVSFCRTHAEKNQL